MMTKQFIPFIFILTFLVFAIILSILSHRQKKILAKDNADHEEFEEEAEMELYLNIIFQKLARITGVEEGINTEKYSSKP
jgi:hypothetical protein